VSVPGYEIESVLGRGGMGVVYKARHLALKRVVALKMILAGGHAAPREQARFRIEAEAVARLQHPNIVQVFEIGASDGHPYCALEFVEGGNLASKIAGKPLPPRQAAKLVEALARAMQLAHSRNVVHRDLKPANVLLAHNGTPKITDFGLARQTDSDSGATQAGQIMGTPSYMAPEQASGRAHEAGTAADIYALGAILYDCLAGRPPFKCKTVVQTLDQVRTQEPVPPSRWQSSVPLDLETICLKCLRKEPEKRYTSAAELADDLVRWEKGEPIRARAVGGLERAVKWVRRNPVMTAAALAVVLALSVGITVGYLNYRDAVTARLTADNRAEERDRARKEAVRDAAEAKKQALRADREAALANGALHSIQIKEALRARDEFDYDRVAQVLDQMRPEYHDALETCYVRNMWLKEAWPRRTLGRAPFRSVAYSPDGKTVLTGSGDLARLWDAETGMEKVVLKGHKHEIYSVCFSPDGKSVLTGSKDQTARLWDAQTGLEKAVLKGHTESVVCTCFSSDGKYALTGSGVFGFWTPKQKVPGDARMWDVQTGHEKVVFKGHVLGLSSTCFSPDGKQVLTGSFDKTARLWDAQTGVEKVVLREQMLADRSMKSRYSIMCVAYSPDGKTVLTGSDDCVARLWDAETGLEKVVLKGHKHAVTSVAYSPAGKTVLTLASGDTMVRLWDAETGMEHAILQGHTRGVTSAAFSPDGKRVVTGSMDTTVRLWDVKPRR
jgi:hypothetical protein